MRNSRKLLTMLVALVLTITMATTSTFAWFTMNERVSVNGIELKVSTADGLQISDTLNGAYKAYLNITDDGIVDHATPVFVGEGANPTYWIPSDTIGEGGDSVWKTASAWNTELSLGYNLDSLFRLPPGTYWKQSNSGSGIKNKDYYRIHSQMTNAQATADGALAVWGFANDKGDMYVLPAPVGDAEPVNDWWFRDVFYFQSDVKMEVKLTSLVMTNTTAEGDALKTYSVESYTVGEFYKTANNQDTIAISPEGSVNPTEIEADVLSAVRVAIFNSAGKLVDVYKYMNGDWEYARGYNGTVDSATGKKLAAELYKGENNTYPVYTEELITTVNLGNPGSILTSNTVETLALSDGTYKGFCTVLIWIEGTDGNCINNLVEQSFSVVMQFTGAKVTPPEESGG